jgi:DNA-directed RNA polymerase subunit RPC12/RpoP
MNGGLTGATDTDYFYFFCPKCPDKRIMRVLDYVVRSEESENPYNSECSKKAKHGFTLAFEVYCENCEHKDFVKISNVGWQGGSYAQALRKSDV